MVRLAATDPLPDVTAVSIYQATLQVPGRVIPDDPVVEEAVLSGEQAFERADCDGVR